MTRSWRFSMSFFLLLLNEFSCMIGFCLFVFTVSKLRESRARSNHSSSLELDLTTPTIWGNLKKTQESGTQQSEKWPWTSWSLSPLRSQSPKQGFFILSFLEILPTILREEENFYFNFYLYNDEKLLLLNRCIVACLKFLSSSTSSSQLLAWC